MRRTDSEEARLFRAPSRFYTQNGSWFYSTREGEHGPFVSREEAEADAQRYAGVQARIEHNRQRTPPD